MLARAVFFHCPGPKSYGQTLACSARLQDRDSRWEPWAITAAEECPAPSRCIESGLLPAILPPRTTSWLFRGSGGRYHDRAFPDTFVLEQAEGSSGHVIAQTHSAKEVSPWLQLTRWSRYLEGHRLSNLVALAAQPHCTSEPVLTTLCQSLDRLVQDAYESVCEDRINVFDQTRINSFLQGGRPSDRPLMVKLRKATWRKYIGIWKALICFAYRTSRPGCSIVLQHQLTGNQVVCLEEAVQHAETVLQLAGAKPVARDRALALEEQASKLLDDCCLNLCIALLDHNLRGPLFESVVVGFLAVLGIDAAKGVLKEAYHYTPTLSGFIKIAQMLVIQKAVADARNHPTVLPTDLLDEMRARFLIHTSRSPFVWANRFRIYGKKVRDSKTCLGYITWSEDEQVVSYKDICGLSMDKFRSFVRNQVTKAQGQLEQLLLLHPAETREDLGVEFRMHRIVDNAVENRKGWNFLRHERNLSGALPDRRNWLLDRVLENDWLQDEFFQAASTNRSPKWNLSTITAYKASVDSLLESLLLLIHITAGQPARGTELLSLRHVNTVHGHHRNIFIENGMVSTVTAYHKGYSITGSTKIIHRYLPKEVGELLVYYLWLVHPFCRQVDLLVFPGKDPPSPFLWAGKGQEPWDSVRLSRVLQREFRSELGLPVNIPIYRHLAIAISRKHLNSGRFKRDYELEATDRQAAHNPWTAGSIYARGLDEAAGHVETRKTEYRKISQEWHQFLGFLPTSLLGRKRPLSDVTNSFDRPVKQSRIHDVAKAGESDTSDQWIF